ncbi:UDP-Glycosyltransferase/glycogen phosphorylase [Westerdykella ornata]|uniref:GDP-Man:Man(3)GlcNAc(2)-PP-Dol alpha-1,2-mannosyltransferase n=1 Tax=Westerdykella ornata TaxID=318751 RepID=A0A6A6J808_WESOR|nr:UDP-Glycosyltransferase/glycogen phosphorylase [Westerdykella ornata]KAF2272720.1 UDP-Glycosyltransferase/glycogen phosphorylase [Westerdykella ornata]
MGVVSVLLSVCFAVVIASIFIPATFHASGRLVGKYLRGASRTRRELLIARTAKEQKEYEERVNTEREVRRKDSDEWEEVEGALVGSAANGEQAADQDWSGIIGFFHPFCNAGGGGERVLWEAIRATQLRRPEAICVVYTGDHDVDKSAILKRVEERFNIHLHAPSIHFLYLTKRDYVLSSTWPRFTLLGQSIGSIFLALDAFQLLVPDIFIDTMGYAFATWLSTILFPDVPTGAYVHYPTISTDMLDSLSSGGQGIHAGAGVGLRGLLKRAYWHIFASLYSRVGSTIDVVMTNSSWTQAHIKSLWGPFRKRQNTTTNQDTEDISVVFPPVAVADLERAIHIDEQSEATRRRDIVYIAQFRPEKNHEMILRAFASFARPEIKASKDGGGVIIGRRPVPRLILIGNMRASDEMRVYTLRVLARELGVDEYVKFVPDAKWEAMVEYMAQSSVGVNGMWSEHFGIGVVEYQAAGLICVVHDSGGPKMDIVVDVEGEPTGYHASSVEEYAAAFDKALSLPAEEALKMRLRARRSARRFSTQVFGEKWVRRMEELIRLRRQRVGVRGL